MARFTYRIFYESGSYIARIYSGANIINEKGGFMNMFRAQEWAETQI